MDGYGMDNTTGKTYLPIESYENNINSTLGSRKALRTSQRSTIISAYAIIHPLGKVEMPRIKYLWPGWDGMARDVDGTRNERNSHEAGAIFFLHQNSYSLKMKLMRIFGFSPLFHLWLFGCQLAFCLLSK